MTDRPVFLKELLTAIKWSVVLEGSGQERIDPAQLIHRLNHIESENNELEQKARSEGYRDGSAQVSAGFIVMLDREIRTTKSEKVRRAIARLLIEIGE